MWGKVGEEVSRVGWEVGGRQWGRRSLLVSLIKKQSMYSCGGQRGRRQEREGREGRVRKVIQGVEPKPGMEEGVGFMWQQGGSR